MHAHIRCSLTLAVLILGLASPATAAEWTWAGPDGGEVHSLALQPRTNVLYAGTMSGVFRSHDGGATWLPPKEWRAGSPVFHIAVDPSRPAIVYAGLEGSLFKSIDGGVNWAGVNSGLPNVSALAVSRGGTLYVGTWAGLFRSRDGGVDWRQAGQGLPHEKTVTALKIDPSRPERIYAGLHNGLYRSTDGGARWVAASGAAVASGVFDIEVSPASSQIVYAATSKGVARSFDGGATWLPGQGLTQVNDVAAHPILPGTVYAGTPDGVFKSADRGATWARVSEGLSDVDVQALEIDPAAPGTLWAGTAENDRLGGVFQTTDGGAHWAFRSSGLSSVIVKAFEVDPHTPGTLFASLIDHGTGNFGLVRSRDRGLHWTVLPIPPGIVITDVEVDPVDPSVVYAATATGGPLLKSTNGGDSWSRLGTLPEALSVLAIDPDHPAVLYGGGPESGFYKSVDAGATWVQNPTFPRADPVQIEVAPGVLYAIASLPVPVIITWPFIFRSTDAGETWETLDLGSRAPRELAVSPSDPETVYMFTDDDVIYRTTDGGDTWHLASQLFDVSSLAIAPGSPETLYAAVREQGVFASTDGGATWMPAGEGPEGLFSFSDLVVDPHDPGRLYVAVVSHGLATLFEPDSCEPGPTVLCLQGDRFHVEVAWKDHQGNTGFGRTIPMSAATGAFWFFDPGNVELVVKILDGRGVNGRFWVFAASLTNVEFTLTVTDTETGKQKVYHNPSGHMASFGNTDAF